MATSRPSDSVSPPRDLDRALMDVRERTLIVAALLEQIEDWALSLPAGDMPERLLALIIAAREQAEEAFQAARDVASHLI